MRSHLPIVVAVTCGLLLPVGAAHGADDDTTTGDVSTGGRVPSTTAPLPPLTIEPTPEKDVDVAPLVHCVFVLPDMDPATPTHEYVANGSGDDLPSVPTPTPCAIDVASGVPTWTLPDEPTASVKPNSADSPGTRRVEVWAAFTHPTGPGTIDGVTIEVRDDKGNPLPTSDAMIAATPATAAGALGGAGLTGQLEAGAGATLQQMAADGWLLLAHAVVQVSVDDPCGPATVDVSASADGQVVRTTSSFDIICFQELSADFSSVEWGELLPGTLSIVAGDHDAATAARPTIANGGNIPMTPATTFQPLCLVTNPARCITTFAVELGVGDTAAVRIGPDTAGVELVNASAVLCPGDVARVDFLVLPPEGAAAGDYAGSLRMVGAPVEVDECAEPPPVTTTTTTTTTAPATTTTAPATTTTAPATTTTRPGR